jgi:endogenous inhibitor of DNA gyrase (YacG/DUF329 family)
MEFQWPCPKCEVPVALTHESPRELPCPHCGVALHVFWDEDVDGDHWMGVELAKE